MVSGGRTVLSSNLQQSLRMHERDCRKRAYVLLIVNEMKVLHVCTCNCVCTGTTTRIYTISATEFNYMALHT